MTQRTTELQLISVLGPSQFVCVASLILVSCVSQITLASSRRRGLTVALKLEMCLQVRGDSPSHCFGTIRYISCGDIRNRRDSITFVTFSDRY